MITDLLDCSVLLLNTICLPFIFEVVNYGYKVIQSSHINFAKHYYLSNN